MSEYWGDAEAARPFWNFASAAVLDVAMSLSSSLRSKVPRRFAQIIEDAVLSLGLLFHMAVGPIQSVGIPITIAK
jgi:hypothetical protein